MGLPVDDDREEPVQRDHPGDLVEDHGLEEKGAEDERLGDPDQQGECLEPQRPSELRTSGATEDDVDTPSSAGSTRSAHGETPSSVVSTQLRSGTIGGKSTYPNAGCRPLAM